jgi:hypothetical protein
MRTSLRMAAGAALTAALIAGATPSFATDIETFTEFHQLTTTKGVHWIRTQVGASNSRARLEGGRLFTKNSGTAAIGDAAGELSTSFSFLDPTLAVLLNEGTGLRAGFILDATVTPSTGGVFVDGDGNWTQDHVNGSFAFIYRGPTPISDGHTTVFNGDVLLSATFHDAALRGKAGGSTIAFDDSTFAGITHNIDYFSPFLDFSASTPDPGHLITGRDFVFGFSSIASPGLGIGPSTACTVGVGPCAKGFNNFNATASGNMGANPAPKTYVPEPATWGLMIVGFAGIGAALRRRRRAALA